MSANSAPQALDPGTPVEVLMPAALLPRLAEPLAMLGLRLYLIPTKGGPTLMIGADLSELRDSDAPASLTVADVLETWSFAVESLVETTRDASRRPKARKPRPRRATR